MKNDFSNSCNFYPSLNGNSAKFHEYSICNEYNDSGLASLFFALAEKKTLTSFSFHVDGEGIVGKYAIQSLISSV